MRRIPRRHFLACRYHCRGGAAHARAGAARGLAEHPTRVPASRGERRSARRSRHVMDPRHLPGSSHQRPVGRGAGRETGSSGRPRRARRAPRATSRSRSTSTGSSLGRRTTTASKPAALSRRSDAPGRCRRGAPPASGSAWCRAPITRSVPQCLRRTRQAHRPRRHPPPRRLHLRVHERRLRRWHGHEPPAPALFGDHRAGRLSGAARAYKADPDSQEAHRQHPFIVVWDDHELANNTWSGGARTTIPRGVRATGRLPQRRGAGVLRVDADSRGRHRAVAAHLPCAQVGPAGRPRDARHTAGRPRPTGCDAGRRGGHRVANAIPARPRAGSLASHRTRRVRVRARAGSCSGSR